MAKHPRRPRDPMQLAKLVGDIATGQACDPQPPPETSATQARRKGGLKGGKSRAERIPGPKRREIAKAAARARWSK